MGIILMVGVMAIGLSLLLMLLIFKSIPISLLRQWLSHAQLSLSGTKQEVQGVRPFLFRRQLGQWKKQLPSTLKPKHENQLIFLKFCEYYFLLLGPFPHLSFPERKLLSEYLPHLDQPMMRIEDYIEEVFKDSLLQEQLQKLGSVVERKGHELLLATFVADVLILLSLPTILTTSLNVGPPHNFSHKSTGHLSLKTVQTLLANFHNDLTQTKENKKTLTDFLDAKDYPHLSYPQRRLILSLLNFSPKVREAVLKDDLFTSFFESRCLVEWELGCSDFDEQYFLNTCKTAAYNSLLVCHSSNVLVLLVLGELVIEHMTRALPPSQLPSSPAFHSFFGRAPNLPLYVSSIIERASTNYQIIRKKARVIFEKEKTRDLKSLDGEEFLEEIEKRQQLTLDWNYTTQQLSAIFFLSYPIFLSRKLFTNDWEASAKLHLISSCLSSFLPGLPPLSVRTQPTRRNYVEMAFFLEFDVEFDSKFHHHLEDFSEKIVKCGEDEGRKLEMMKELWREVFVLRGVVFSWVDRLVGYPVGHLCLLLAILQDGRELFLIGDPEYTLYKPFSFIEMLRFVSEPQNQFDLFRVK